mgnify:CR=1 FL=1
MRTLLSCFNRLKSIQYPEDERTPSSWFSVQPCARIHFAGREWIVTQPMSTFWVYALGVLTIGAGLYFLQIRAGEASRLWWGVSLLLWGIGAVLAGTSYQAFGYQIKCTGGETCCWTSWWEVVYLMFQQVSMSAMLAAIAYSCSTGPLREILLIYAVVNSTVYVAAIFISGIIPYKPLITFEFMVFASCPIFLMMIGVNGWRYLSLRESMDLALLGTWALLGVSMLAYWVYDKAKVTETLWAKGKGRWFSQNDVLHVFLIVWIIYIAVVVSGQIHDM